MYEATQAPLPTADAPVLNPTGGVKGQPLHSKLDFEKDETRPGGGVFVVRGELNEKDVDKLPKGTIVAGEVGKRGDEGEAPRTVSSASRSSIANDASSSSAPLSPTRTAPPPLGRARARFPAVRRPWKAIAIPGIVENMSSLACG